MISPPEMKLKSSLQRELRYLLPAWLVCVLLPGALVLFWRTPYGKSSAPALFSLTCASLAAFSFRRDLRPENVSVAAERGPEIWRERILPLGLALFAAAGLFSILSLAADDSRDFAAPMLSFMTLVPALGIVPCLVLATRSAIAGVVFSTLLVGSMKTPIGAFFVRTFFPDHFQQSTDIDGSLIMPTPWLHPNLLVWFFYVSIFVLSVVLYSWNVRKFRRLYKRVAL